MAGKALHPFQIIWNFPFSEEVLNEYRVRGILLVNTSKRLIMYLFNLEIKSLLTEHQGAELN